MTMTSKKKPDSSDISIQQVTVDNEKHRKKVETDRIEPVETIPELTIKEEKDPTFSPEMVGQIHGLIFTMVAGFTNDPTWALTPEECNILGKLGAKVADKYLGDALGENSEEVVYAVGLLTVIGGRMMKNANKPKTQDNTGQLGGGALQVIPPDDARLHPGQEHSSKGSGEVAGTSHRMVSPDQGSAQ